MAGGKSNPFESSMTDLMISLALIFMLLLASVLFQITIERETEKNKALSTKDEILQELSQELAKLGVKTQEDPNDPLALVIIVGEDKLNFISGESDFERDKDKDKKKKLAFLKKLIPSIVSVLDKESFKDAIDSIRIEGYTDSDDSDEFNLELSQDRALFVLKEALKILKSNSSQKNFLLDNASVIGRGESKKYLIFENGKENKDKSRRVEIKVKIKSQLEDLLIKEKNAQNI